MYLNITMSLTTLDKNTLKRETTGIRPFCRCFKNDECVMATLVLDSDFQVVFNQHNILSGSYIPLRVRRDNFRQRHHQHLRKEFEPLWPCNIRMQSNSRRFSVAGAEWSKEWPRS